jgi:hypothetical protein
MALHWPSTPIVLPSCTIGLLLSLPLALACNPDEVPPLPVVPPERAIYSPPSCHVAFSPDEGLLPDVELAAERWSAATGCDIDVSDAGVPVTIVASIVRPDGSQAPGWTSDERDRVEINVRCGTAQRTSATFHELGHALGGDHVESDGILSGQKGRRDVIDEASLASVCSRLDCPAFNPEEP